jgi:hypothetical protein
MELCVCGKFADMECSECGLRGYCSLDCQQDDWFKHAMICQEKIEENKQRKQSKSSKSKKKKKKHKKHHKKHKKSKSRASSTSSSILNIDVCVCGKEAEFECSNCEKQGYCSEECQLKDWITHQKCCEMSGDDRDTVAQPSGSDDQDDDDELQNGHGDDATSKVKSGINGNAPFNRYTCKSIKSWY